MRRAERDNKRVNTKIAYTIDEVADLLGVSHNSVRRLVDAGTLRSVVVKADPRAKRGCRRITTNQLASYVKSLEIAAR